MILQWKGLTGGKSENFTKGSDTVPGGKM